MGSTFGGFALVMVYLLISVGAPRTFATSQHLVSVAVSAVIGVLITASAIFGSFYKATSPTVLAPWFALGLPALGFASTWVLRARRPTSTQLQDLSARTPAGWSGLCQFWQRTWKDTTNRKSKASVSQRLTRHAMKWSVPVDPDRVVSEYYSSNGS